MGPSKRALVRLYVGVVALAAGLGCSIKDDPSEVLELCGNHSCGELAMITIDTTKDGFQYLEPALSPDQTRLAFSADWLAIPAVPPEGLPPETRQILVMPIPDDLWGPDRLERQPVNTIVSLGAELIRAEDFISFIGGIGRFTENAHGFNKGHPTWLITPGTTQSDTLIFWINVSGRDRLVKGGIQDPGHVTPQVLFYEDEDLLESGWYYYHHDPELSRDGRWLAFTRFGCDQPNVEDRECTLQSIWVLDMWTTDDPRTARAFPVTSGSVSQVTPTWSPDGRRLCFSSRPDIVGEWGGTANELFTISFDPDSAAVADPPLDRDLRRLTTTVTEAGDPITGLHNYAPVFTNDGGTIYFVSSRRAPASTQRGRNLWSVPADGRLEPQILFFSRQDDVDPVVMPSGSLIFSSGLGFPSEVLDALEQVVLDSLYAMNDTLTPPQSEFWIRREAGNARAKLEAFNTGVMSHLYMLRSW